jgi:predicted RNA-binding Zn ribbon-like protein
MTLKAHGDEGHGRGDVGHLGGHVALNFLNTSRMRGGSLVDTLQADSDVRAWMHTMGLPEPVLDQPLRDGALLLAARHLRNVLLEAIQHRKAGKRVVSGELNRLLEMTDSHLVLKQSKGELELVRSYAASSPEEFLAPVTEQIAGLLADEDFDLVRQCEGDVCVLWFLDTTKGHQRRWCSAESCGTRARVAAFRARQSRKSKGKK